MPGHQVPGGGAFAAESNGQLFSLLFKAGQRVYGQPRADDELGVEPGIVFPLGDNTSSRVLQPRLHPGQSTEEGQVNLAMGKSRDYRGIVHAGRVLNRHPQLPR